jgi:hypothetical protein
MMPAWLRPLVDAFVGRVPGRPGRLDTATRMAIDADFRERDRPRGPRRERPTSDVDPL